LSPSKVGIILLTLFLLFTLLAAIGNCSNGVNSVLRVNVTGEITVATTTMISDALRLAEAQNVRLVIVTLNTPGGEVGAVQDIMNLFDNSTIPIVGFVYPPGATAWSGGTYILMATHVAVMASGTTIGSCQPVNSAGQPIDFTKYLNALTALMQNHAILHNRNATMAGLFVTENANLGPADAYRFHVVEILADNTGSLLSQLENFVLVHVEETSGLMVWRLVPAGNAQNYTSPLSFGNISQATITDYTPGIQVVFLSFLLNPIISSLLLIVGVFLFFIGLKTPGWGAEIAGGVAIFLALIGFEAIGITIGAVFLFALGAILIIAELKTHIGVLAISGAICMIIASLLLFPSPQWLLYYQVSQQIQAGLVIFTIVMATLFSFIVYKAAKARLSKVKTGREALIGARGVVVTDLAPKGEIRVSGEFWHARAESGAIPKGETVEVVRMEGLFLIVKPVKEKT